MDEWLLNDSFSFVCVVVSLCALNGNNQAANGRKRPVGGSDWDNNIIIIVTKYVILLECPLLARERDDRSKVCCVLQTKDCSINRLSIGLLNWMELNWKYYWQYKMLQKANMTHTLIYYSEMMTAFPTPSKWWPFLHQRQVENGTPLELKIFLAFFRISHHHLQHKITAPLTIVPLRHSGTIFGTFGMLNPVKTIDDGCLKN